MPTMRTYMAPTHKQPTDNMPKMQITLLEQTKKGTKKMTNQEKQLWQKIHTPKVELILFARKGKIDIMKIIDIKDIPKPKRKPKK